MRPPSFKARWCATSSCPISTCSAHWVYAIEVFIAVSLILGVVTRIGAALGALMAINLWLGLYNAPGEWPWTYMFLVVLQLIFLINPPGRSLGIDALAWGVRARHARTYRSFLSWREA